VKICPECRNQFGDEHEFCPRHGVKLLLMAPGQTPASIITASSSPASMQTVMAYPGYVPPENYDRLIGQLIDGRYIIDTKLGEGGMGVVFRAHHTVIERTVAIKILKKEVARDKAVVQRFVQEAKAASRIGHAAIVDVIDFGSLPDGSAYSVMEFIDGVTLNKVIKAGPMRATRALPVAGQIARALAAAHEKGIVHRDLKPENVFLYEKGGRQDLVKIVDFGIAKFAPVGNVDGPTRITRGGAVFGTPEYMAPEQAAGRSDNDHRVDIYALGTVMYEMLVGRVPHKGETIVATLAQQMLDPIELPRRMNPRADVTDALEAVIMTALAKDRDKRYPTMGDLWVALETAAMGMGVALEPFGGQLPLRGSDRYGPVTGPPGPPTSPTGPERRPGMWAPTVPDASAAMAAGAAIGRHARRGRRRVIAALLGLAGLAGITLAIALAMRRVGPEQAGETPDAAAGVVAAAHADAGGAVAVARPDAAPVVATTGTPDAGPTIVASGTPDAAPEVLVVVRHPEHDVRVSTDPRGAALYIGEVNYGLDGSVFRRAEGTRMDIRCRFPDNDLWDNGRVSVIFDGRSREVKCVLHKRPRCLKELKNPFASNCPADD
jgi:serine/threonine-protein kinase